jgi:hypothetical protein
MKREQYMTLVREFHRASQIGPGIFLHLPSGKISRQPTIEGAQQQIVARRSSSECPTLHDIEGSGTDSDFGPNRK